MDPIVPVDRAVIASALARITANWTPAPNVAPATLDAARQALAATLLAGRSASDLHAVKLPIEAGDPADPTLAETLCASVATAASAPQPATMAIVRSPLAASLENPTGVPDWARGAQVVSSLGPFADAHGILHWVDVIRITVSTRFAFGDVSKPFAVFPVSRFVVLEPSPRQLTLGAGSLWFLAKWLSSSLPDGFTGFSISGGTLQVSAPLSLQNGVYVVPVGATLTLSVKLVAAPTPTGPSDPGGDAFAARFVPPASVTLVFKDSSVSLEAVADASATAYGSTIALRHNNQAPVASPNLPQIVIPCDATPHTFTFAAVASNLFTPSAATSIVNAGWALALAATDIAHLPEAAGPGSGLLQLRTGASVKTQVQPTLVVVSNWLVQIATGGLFVLAFGAAKRTKTDYRLWAERAPSKLRAGVEFLTNATFAYGFLAAPGSELLTATGELTAHVDRPVAATGTRFPYASTAVLLLDRSRTADVLVLIGGRADVRKPVISIALENALIGVDAPALFTLAGTLNNDTVERGIVGMYFDARWLLPTLPDPYAANFDLSLVRSETASVGIGTLLAVTTWANVTADAALAFLLLPPAQAPASNSPFALPDVVAGATVEAAPRLSLRSTLALLDLSTRVDLFGVAFLPNFDRFAARALPVEQPTQPGPPALGPGAPAPLVALDGMALALNGATVATFALPQVSWEPMASTAPGLSEAIVEDPASDGAPLLVATQDVQQLVPFMPDAALLNNISNVADGVPFSVVFSLPFGLDAFVRQPNVRLPRGPIRSSFIRQGGRFSTNRPEFPLVFPASPPTDAARSPPSQPSTTTLTGALNLTMKPTQPWRKDAAFPGVTQIAGAYGERVLGDGADPLAPANQFRQQFTQGVPGGAPSVPLRRIDFTGYGASIFSQWAIDVKEPPAITKVEFETTLGRTAYEVVQAVNAIQPYWIPTVRTITIERRNAGWIRRADSGWKPVGPGRFQFPRPEWDNHVHPGALAGVFNVRNIRTLPETVSFSTPTRPEPFIFQKVLFDADLGIDPSIKVVAGGFNAPVEGVTNPPTLVASRDLVGYMQTQPIKTVPLPNELKLLFDQVGRFTPTIGCSVEVGSFGGQPGATLRCSAFEVAMFTGTLSGPVPALGVALRHAPAIPSGGGWSLGHRRFTDPAPAALPTNFPVPLVRPAGETNFWYIADVEDVLQLANPENFYSLLHSTGTHKVLFESPQIPVSAAVSPAPSGPGVQFPKPNPPGPLRPGAAPLNPGSPNLGDLASILNSTGLFPDVAAALSLISGVVEEINTIPQGVRYRKDHTFDPNTRVTIADIDVIKIVLQYADTTPLRGLQQPPIGPPPVLDPAKLSYTVDSASSPSWKLSVKTLSFLVSVPAFGSSPLLTITGGFSADEHTAPGVTDLNVQFGDALSILKDIFSSLQAVAQFLPGGAKAGLDVALSDGKLTVRDTFTINDMPLGLGNLTDVSVNLGLQVSLAPMSIDFSVSLGQQDNPFNWIVSPLAGNGLILLGVQDSKPALIMQAGIGLGLAIDLGIASGSASVVIAFQVQAAPPDVTLVAILTGHASVDVLDGLASAALTLSAGLGFRLQALPPPVDVQIAPPSISIGPETITLIATCSVGIHLSVCWVASVDWDGSWQFQQSVTTPQVKLSI